jgi:hypothetical protein
LAISAMGRLDILAVMPTSLDQSLFQSNYPQGFAVVHAVQQ